MGRGGRGPGRVDPHMMGPMYPTMPQMMGPIPPGTGQPYHTAMGPNQYPPGAIFWSPPQGYYAPPGMPPQFPPGARQSASFPFPSPFMNGPQHVESESGGNSEASSKNKKKKR